MKSILTAVLALGVLVSATALGQAPPEAEFTKFDLDFPGGTPGELVTAIEEATGRPLNAIIPTEHADMQLPPLKMRNVTAPMLFESLQQSSMRQVRYETGATYGLGRAMPSYAVATVSFGFRCLGSGFPHGDDTIWTFHVEEAPAPTPQPVACRYYQLEAYLESYSIDDITTAIQTGWEMLGRKDTPELSFHKETRLLIAVGNPDLLALIEDVLGQLRPPDAEEDPGNAAAATPKPTESK